MKKGTSCTTLETQIPDREGHSYWFYSTGSIIDACYSGAAKLPGSKYVSKDSNASVASATYDRVWERIPTINERIPGDLYGINL